MSISEAARRLGLRYPIIQGPFGGGLSTLKLVATVSNAGGMGSFGAHVTPPDQIEALTRDARAQTNQPFALNLWISDHDPGGLELSQEEFDRVYQRFEPYFRELGLDKPERPQRYHQSYEKQIEALLEARPPAFSFVFGIPSAKILAECRRRGIVTLGTATSIAEAQALEAAGVDLIIATGLDAGGHRPSFLASAEESLMGTMSVTQLIAARVKVPVVAAGGIADGRGMKAAFALGAQAVQIGTAFLACEESGTTPEHRAILFSDKAQHTVLTRAFSGRLARGVRNRWTDEIAPRLGAIAPFPVQNWFMSRLRPAAVKAGRTDLVSLWAGQVSPNLKHRNAGALMASLIAEEA